MAEKSGKDAGGESPRISARAKRILAIAGIVVLVALIAWFIRYQLHGKYMESTEDAYIQADAVTVAPKVAGYVEQVFVTDNQDVRAGQPLARIDARDYKARAAQYQAQIDVAKADAENVRATIAEQQAAIDQARADLAAAQTDARFAQGEVMRYTPLAESGAETREHLTTLRREATDAANKVTSARAALERAERRVASLQANVTQAKAQGETALAQRSTADVDVASTIVRASIDGRVGSKTVRVGQYVQVGTRMMSVVPIERVYVTANFKETQLGLMRIGQPAEIEIDSLPGVTLSGHVDSVSPGTGAQFSLLPPENATGNFIKIVQRVPVKIAIDAGAATRKVLVPGMSVHATVDTIGAKGELARIRDDQRAQAEKGR